MRRALAFAAGLVALAAATSARADEAGSKPEPTRAIAARASGGVTALGLFDVGAIGPRAAVGIGGTARRSFALLGAFADLAYERPVTSHGLVMHRGTLAATGEVVFAKILRLGVGLHAGALAIERQGGASGTPWKPVLGAHATVGVDVITVRGATLYADARGDYETAFVARVLSAGGVAGVRYAF